LVQTLTSVDSSRVSPEQLQRILADYMALEHASVFRRLLVVRCGVLSLVTAAAAPFVHGLSAYARWGGAGLFLVPPVWAWIAEIRLRMRFLKNSAVPGAEVQVRKS